MQTGMRPYNRPVLSRISRSCRTGPRVRRRSRWTTRRACVGVCETLPLSTFKDDGLRHQKVQGAPSHGYEPRQRAVNSLVLNRVVGGNQRPPKRRRSIQCPCKYCVQFSELYNVHLGMTGTAICNSRKFQGKRINQLDAVPNSTPNELQPRGYRHAQAINGYTFTQISLMVLSMRNGSFCDPSHAICESRC